MTPLRRIEEALAGLTDIELRALIVASNEVPQIAPGLLAWLEGACDWELNRRAGQDYDLQPPEAAIDPSEDQVSIDAAYVVRDSFSGTELEAGVRTFFDELIELLTGGGKKH